MNSKWIFIIGLSVFSLTACEEGFRYGSETSGLDSTNVQFLTEPLEKRLTFGDYQLVAKTEKVGSLTNLAIRGLVGENPLSSSVNRKVELLSGIEIADFNEDGQPEVYAFDHSASSGNYGRILGFSFTPQGTWSEITVDELSPETQKGYKGRDQFRIEAGKIFRVFPVYDGNDVDSKPTGKEMTIIYTLEKKGEGFHLTASN